MRKRTTAIREEYQTFESLNSFNGGDIDSLFGCSFVITNLLIEFTGEITEDALPGEKFGVIKSFNIYKKYDSSESYQFIQDIVKARKFSVNHKCSIDIDTTTNITRLLIEYIESLQEQNSLKEELGIIQSSTDVKKKSKRL